MTMRDDDAPNVIGVAHTMGECSATSHGKEYPGIGPMTGAVSDFVASLRYEQIPDDVVRHVKLLILDNIGCAIAGAQLKPARLLREHLTEIGGQGRATVLGTTLSAPAPPAGYANSYAACLLSFDDSHVHLGHLGTAIIPGALAVAQELALSGRDVVTAVTAGYEMALRLGEAIRPTPSRAAKVLGFGTWQIFGAVAAAARLRGFTSLQVADAFGLAMPAAPVPFLKKFGGHPLGWLKNNLGWTTFGALNAVSLASKGFVGNRTTFDGDDGFWIMAGSDRFRPNELVDRMGELWRVGEVGFKPYACCQWAHSSIEALRLLLDETGIRPDGVRAIGIEIAEDFVPSMTGPYPTNFLEAEFHIPFLVALELVGRSSSSGFTEEDIADSIILDLSRKARVTALSGGSARFHDLSQMPSRVTIETCDGARHVKEVAFPPGFPGGRPFGEADVISKFQTLTAPLLGEEKARRVASIIMGLENFDMQQLAGCLVIAE